jgi:hypothetical protein
MVQLSTSSERGKLKIDKTFRVDRGKGGDIEDMAYLGPSFANIAPLKSSGRSKAI